MSFGMDDPRTAARLSSEARACLIRELDPNRFEIYGRLEDVSSTGLCILLPAPLELDDYVSIRLENPIQHAKAQTRGFVERVERQQDGTYRVAISLLRRLTPREVQDQCRYQTVVD